MNLDQVKNSLVKRFPNNLIIQLLDCYQEQKRNFFLGNHRPSEVEGGRFSEASFRMLEHFVNLPVTPIGKQLDTDNLIRRLQALPSSIPDSIRLHIPRTLRVIYDIRNKRDAAHLADGIDPNLQDASFVFASLDWILAEFIRLSEGMHPNDAFNLIKGITIHAIPTIENFDGFLKTLNPTLKASKIILLLLYHQGTKGATLENLNEWVKPKQRSNIKRTLQQLEHEKDFIVFTKGQYQITRLGILEVQRKKIIEI